MYFSVCSVLESFLIILFVLITIFIAVPSTGSAPKLDLSQLLANKVLVLKITRAKKRNYEQVMSELVHIPGVTWPLIAELFAAILQPSHQFRLYVNNAPSRCVFLTELALVQLEHGEMQEACDTLLMGAELGDPACIEALEICFHQVATIFPPEMQQRFARLLSGINVSIISYFVNIIEVFLFAYIKWLFFVCLGTPRCQASYRTNQEA